jgi:predicted 3-demethylubiquinone-9 3-methyltransferase (glyoxalase superfamily)
MQQITPFLWYNTNAEEAANFYVSIFPNSAITNVARYGKAGPGPEGSAMTVAFTLNGLNFVGLNGGPTYQFTEAVSFVISCETQEEVDMYWDNLCEGGKPNVCGWLKDKFGLSWQVVPTILPKLLTSADREGSQRAMKAMMGMAKLDIAALQKAYDGE